MADAFTPDLFSEFRRTASPQTGRGAVKRGRGLGKRGRGGNMKQRSVNTSQEVPAPPDPPPESKRKRRNTSDSVDMATISQSISAVSNDEQEELVRTNTKYSGLSLVSRVRTKALLWRTNESLLYIISATLKQ